MLVGGIPARWFRILPARVSDTHLSFKTVQETILREYQILAFGTSRSVWRIKEGIVKQEHTYGNQYFRERVWKHHCLISLQQARWKNRKNLKHTISKACLYDIYDGIIRWIIKTDRWRKREKQVSEQMGNMRKSAERCTKVRKGAQRCIFAHRP